MIKFLGVAQLEAKELVEYDEATGRLFWNKRDEKWFRNSGPYTAKTFSDRFNTRCAGKEAIYTKNNNRNCLQGSFLGRSVHAHRLIWFWMTGEIPQTIDHINGDGFDNRWANLRSVSTQENTKNQKLRYDSTSGVTGVSKVKGYELWESYIWVDYKKISLGRFPQFEDAVAARKAAEAKYGFHPNHGRSKPDA